MDAEESGRSPSGRAVVNGAASVSALRASVPSAGEVRTLLRRLANATGNTACLNSTAMIPLHKETVKMIADMIEAPTYPPICGYPIDGWQLGFVKFDVPNDGQPAGWLVKLQRERLSWHEHRMETNVMARSDVGPLEAWEEAIRMARRCDERAAQAIEAASAAETDTGSVHESAVPQGCAQTTDIQP